MPAPVSCDACSDTTHARAHRNSLAGRRLYTHSRSLSLPFSFLLGDAYTQRRRETTAALEHNQPAELSEEQQHLPGLAHKRMHVYTYNTQRASERRSVRGGDRVLHRTAIPFHPLLDVLIYRPTILQSRRERAERQRERVAVPLPTVPARQSDATYRFQRIYNIRLNEEEGLYAGMSIGLPDFPNDAACIYIFMCIYVR